MTPRLPIQRATPTQRLKCHRNADYLAWLRDLPCHRCGCVPYIGCEAAHVRLGQGGGVGLKPSDYRAIPLCHRCHALQHQNGEQSFWAEIGHDPHGVIAEYLVRYSMEPAYVVEELERIIEEERA